MRRLCDYIKAHSYGLFVFAITMVVTAFIGVLAARMINITETESPEIKHDTIYVKPSVTDSILQSISTQVNEINSKLPVKKSGGKRRIVKNDTIKLDATILLDKGE